MASKILKLSLFLVLYSCSRGESNKTITHFKKSEISKYIDFTNEVQPIEGDCLKQIKKSLTDVIWGPSTGINHAISFSPKNYNNPYKKYRGNQKWICFFVSEVQEKDTTYSFETYHYNSYLHSFKPCYFEPNNVIRVDTVIDITPKLEFLKNNCVLEVTRTDFEEGVFKQVHLDSSVLSKEK